MFNVRGKIKTGIIFKKAKVILSLIKYNENFLEKDIRQEFETFNQTFMFTNVKKGIYTIKVYLLLPNHIESREDLKDNYWQFFTIKKEIEIDKDVDIEFDEDLYSENLPKIYYKQNQKYIDYYLNEYVQKGLYNYIKEKVDIPDFSFSLLFTKYFPNIQSRVDLATEFYEREKAFNNAKTNINNHIVNKIKELLNRYPIYVWAEWEYYLSSGDDSRLLETLLLLDKKILNLDHSTIYDKLKNKYEEKDKCLTYIIFRSIHFLYMSKIAAKVGHKELYKKYYEDYKKSKALINSYYWNKNKNSYLEKDLNNTVIDFTTLVNVLPLKAQIPSQGQAKKVITQSIKKKSEFNKHLLLPLITFEQNNLDEGALNECNNAYLYLSYMVIEGLQKYGYDGIARKIAKGNIYNSLKNINKHNKFLSSGVMTLLIEQIVGLRFDSDKNTIQWFIKSKSKTGVENIYFNCQYISLTSIVQDNKLKISVKANKTFILNIQFYNKLNKQFIIEPGEHQYFLYVD